MAKEAEALLNQLLEEDLSGVTFVRDYLQLQFNPPPILNVYTSCRVTIDGKTVIFGEPDFANCILSMIGMDVVRVGEDQDTLTILFERDAKIEIPLRGDDKIVEACFMMGRDDMWGTWP